MFRCERATGSLTTDIRDFDTLEEAYRFVMREGDQSRLWSLEEVDGTVDANNEAAWDRIYGHGTIRERT